MILFDVLFYFAKRAQAVVGVEDVIGPATILFYCYFSKYGIAINSKFVSFCIRGSNTNVTICHSIDKKGWISIITYKKIISIRPNICMRRSCPYPKVHLADIVAHRNPGIGSGGIFK